MGFWIGAEERRCPVAEKSLESNFSFGCSLNGSCPFIAFTTSPERGGRKRRQRTQVEWSQPWSGSWQTWALISLL